jgi:hypothetical protein
MTDLPVWLQEVRDRADKATEGPWDMVWEDGEAYVFRGRNWNREWVASAATSDDTAFIAHARTDVPRLVELVGEMAWNLRNVTDQVQDACRSRMTPLSQCPEPSDDYCPTCPTGLRGECGAPRSLEALRKFRGEVSSND